MTNFGVARAPRLVLFGSGQRKALSTIARGYGSRAFICSDARFDQDPDLRAMATDLREKGLNVEAYTETIAELPLDCILSAAERARAFSPDVIIGIGGGSCLDLAKLVSVLLAHPGPLSEYYGEFRVPGPVVRLIGVPTTAGTGSEVTPVAVLADPVRDMKIGISSPHLIPEVAICDPELTLSCPRGLTAITGADALTHAIESYTAVQKPVTPELALQQVFVGKNALSDTHALAAIAALAGYLERAVNDGTDIEAREKVMLGALSAALSFSTAGTAAAHAIQYPVGALTSTAHGLGVAALLPYVMEFNFSTRVAEFAEIGRLFGVARDGDSEELLASKAIDAVDALLQRIGIPKSLAALGLADEKQAWVADQALLAARLVKNNPRPLDGPQMHRIVAAAYAGDRSSLRIN